MSKEQENLPAVWTVLSMLEWATGYFEKKQIPNPRLSIEWLLSHVLDIKRLDLYLKFDRPLSGDELEKLRPLVQRRSEHEPLQYILGTTEFMHCPITVDPRALIPRPETEQLTELLLQATEADRESPKTILDIGTGSGCIPVAIATLRPSWRCVGLDISEEALELARENALRNDAEVTFLRKDLFDLEGPDDLDETGFDLIISNPPYIEPDEKGTLEPQVIRYEPALALFDEDPIRLYTHLLTFSARSLYPGGRLFLECNPRHIDQIVQLAQTSYASVEIHNDYGQEKRFIEALKAE